MLRSGDGEMEVLDRRRALGGPASKRKLPCLDVT